MLHGPGGETRRDAGLMGRKGSKIKCFQNGQAVARSGGSNCWFFTFCMLVLNPSSLGNALHSGSLALHFQIYKLQQ